MNSVKTHYLILLLALCLLASSTAKSQINQGRTSRYYVEHYGQEEGLPQNSVNNLFPDANGFIWVATESGIARFNGNRFIPVPVKKGIGNISFARVKNFYAKGKDTIMAYSAAGHSIAFIVNNEIVASEKHFYPKHGLLFSTLHQPVQAPSFLLDNVPGEGIRLHWDISKGMYNGTVYNKDTFLVILYGGLGVFNNKGLINKIEIDNLNASRMVYVNGRALYLDDQNYINLYSVMSLQQRQPLPISAKKIKIFNNSYGNNFFCVADSVLYRVDVNATGQMKTVRILDNLQNADDITTVYEKDSNSIAIGTLRNGLYVYKRKCFTVSDVLPPGESDVFYVQQLLDDNQTIFTGGNKLFKENIYLGKTKFTVYNHPYSSLKDSKGDYWFAYGNKIISTKTIGGTAADTLLQYGDGPGMFFEDKAGRVWFSSTTKFGYFLNRKFTEVQISNFKGGTISYIEQDINGRYLLGTREGLFILNTINDTTVQEVPALRSLDIRFLLPEANGQIWVCTYGHGFFLLDKDNVTSFTDGGGNLAYVHCLIEDSNGNFWMPTNNGLFVTSRQSLMAYVKNKNMPPYYYEFSKKNGFRTNEFNGGDEPAYLRLPNGDISLASMQGLVSFNPNQVSLNFSSTPILVDNVRLDSMDIFPTGAFDIGNNINNITFSISNSFWGDRPNDVLQYRIIGSKDANTEGQWLFVDASGKVNLFSPSYGKYELQIRKRKGLQPGDYVYKTINFTVLPKWYQTTLFFICRAILFGLLLTGIFFWRRSYYRRSNRILKEKVNAATSQLQQINSTLEKKVEERTEAIQEAEKKFRTLVEGSLAGVYIVQDELYTYVNPRFEEILGYGKGELIGVNSVSVIKEDQQSMVREKVRRRMAGEIESEHYETIILKKDGEERHVEFFGSRTIYEGKPTIIGTMLDITERKITEDQLIQEKDLSNSIINNLPGIFYIFNKEGKHLLWNKNFETVTGYTAAELGEKLAGSMTDEEGIVLLRNGIGRAYTEGYGEAEAALVAKDGTKYYYYYNGITINYNNEPCILGVGIDITERQRAREQLTKEKDLSQSIINNLPGVFYIFDQQGNYLLWNKNHEIVTGYTAAEMSKMHPTKFIEQSYLKSLGERMEKVFKEGYAELEAPFITKDGRMIPYYFNGILINYNDKPCIMGVGIDISERKKAEEQLTLEKNLSQSIISSLPGVLFIFDENRTHQLWNKNYEIVTGYNSEELKNKLAGQCIQESDIAQFAKAVEKMYANGSAEVEVVLINKYKNKIPFYVNGIAITYNNKPCILGIGIDISERKKAEYERERANYLLNERIKELTTLYKAGVILQGESRSIVVTLQDFVSILPSGWQYPDITAACITLGEMQFCTPNFKPGPYAQSSTFITSTGTTGKIEVVYLQESPAEDEGPFLTEERKLIDMLADMLRIYFIRREATDALQKSEANMNTIFANTDTIYVLLDTNFQVITYNQRAAQFAKHELKIGIQAQTNFVKYFPQNRQEELEESMKKVLQGTLVSYEINYVQPDGRYNWYYVRMFPILDANKMVFGMMMVVSDITEKKLLEQEMLNQKIQEQKMMTRAIILGEERERNKIGQELHDNISQILAGTKLYLGMARKNKSGGENIINESIELLDSAIEEIRALSKGKVTPMKKVDLHELLQTLIDRFNETTSIKTNFIYNGSGQLVEDDLKLNVYRIMQEQLNNIYKHSQATVVSILVAVSEKNIRVSVADDGKGFDVDSKKNGIGLVNMINRVASFNGTIDIESRPGNGCKIDINLPC